jgi:hypothetical protein
MLTNDNAARYLTKDGQIARGIKQVSQFPSPAAGQEFTITVPGGEQWFIMAGIFTLTTSGVVANRIPSLSYTIDGVRVHQQQNSSAVAAGTHVDYSIVSSDSPTAYATQGFFGQFQMPLIPLPQTAQIKTQTFNIDAGDQYSAISLYVARVYMTDQQADSYAAEELDELVKALSNGRAKA